MKTSSRVLVLVLALMIVSIPAFSLSIGVHNPDFVMADEAKATLVGILVTDGTVWSVHAADGVYDVQIGNRRFIDSLGISVDEGEEITVFGFVDDTTVIPIVVIDEGDAYFLRDTEGNPLWSNRQAW